MLIVRQGQVTARNLEVGRKEGGGRGRTEREKDSKSKGMHSRVVQSTP